MRAAASIGDVVVCLAPGTKYLRGRAPEDIVALLERGVPSEKLVRPAGRSFYDVLAELRPGPVERTLFVAFGSVGAVVTVPAYFDDAQRQAAYW